ncbi:MAG: hypothetical protein MJ246_06020 [Clostridia bacterium]|nr:hypothetical protein [Clostridia bacterium]
MNNLLVDDVIFCPGYCKSKPIVENNIDVMIDDHIKNVYETSKIIPTI